MGLGWGCGLGVGVGHHHGLEVEENVAEGCELGVEIDQTRALALAPR